MTKSLKLASLFAVAMAVVFTANAQDRLAAYGKANVIWAQFESADWTDSAADGFDMDSADGIGVEVGLGQELGSGFSIEGSILALPSVEFDGSHIRGGAQQAGYTSEVEVGVTALMFDGKWRFTPPESLVQGHLGFGFGYAAISVDDAEATNGVLTYTQEGDDSSNIAFRLSVGLNYVASDVLTLGVSLSYLDLGEADMGTTTTAGIKADGGSFDLTATTLQFGAVIRF